MNEERSLIDSEKRNQDGLLYSLSRHAGHVFLFDQPSSLEVNGGYLNPFRLWFVIELMSFTHLCASDFPPTLMLNEIYVL